MDRGGTTRMLVSNQIFRSSSIEYQDTAIHTDQRDLNDSTEAIMYPFLGLSGEVGELLSQVKKRIRDGDAHTMKWPNVQI